MTEPVRPTDRRHPTIDPELNLKIGDDPFASQNHILQKSISRDSPSDDF